MSDTSQRVKEMIEKIRQMRKGPSAILDDIFDKLEKISTITSICEKVIKIKTTMSSLKTDLLQAENREQNAEIAAAENSNPVFLSFLSNDTNEAVVNTAEGLANVGTAGNEVIQTIDQNIVNEDDDDVKDDGKEGVRINKSEQVQN